MGSVKKILKEITPPFIIKFFKGKNTAWGWFGKYVTWQEAQKNASGYDAPYILEKMKETYRRLRNGENFFERDTIEFPERKYNYQLLFSLSWIALQKKQELNILDFGGSLGSAYYWVRDFLTPHTSLRWSIIDQKHIVKAGKAEFENESLHFYEDFDECFKSENPDILIFSSVLQYIEDYGFLIEQIRQKKFSFIIIDRTPYFKNKEKTSEITIQKLDENMYGQITTLPCRILGQSTFISELEEDYEIVLDNPNFENLVSNFYGDNFYFRFVLLKRKTKT